MKCGSEDLIPGVHVHGGFHARSLKGEVAENPQAWFDKGVHESTLTSVICGKCGFVELYAQEPAELLKAYRRKKPSP